jgi:hypothetical protein
VAIEAYPSLNRPLRQTIGQKIPGKADKVVYAIEKYSFTIQGRNALDNTAHC